MTKTKALLVVIVILAGSAGFADVRVFQLGGHITGDEHSTCMIQARGLPAGHALAGVVGDLHFLVARPLTAQQNEALDVLPPKLRFNLLWTYRDLNRKSASYTRAESKQPTTRKC